MAPSVISAAHSTNGASSTTFDAPVPGSLQLNDLILVSLAWNATSAPAITPPAGTWTALRASSLTGSVGYAWYWHEVTSGEVSSPPAAWTFTTGSSLVGNAITMQIRGHRVGAPFDTAVSHNTSATTSVVTTSLTSTLDSGLLVGFGNLQSATTQSVSVPSGWTQSDTTCTLTLGRGQVVGFKTLGAAGATGDQTWTRTSALAGASAMVVVATSTGFTQTRTDTRGLADVTDAVVTYSRTQDDVRGLTDVVGTAVDYGQVFTDIRGLSDGVAYSLTGAFDRTFGETAGWTDLLEWSVTTSQMTFSPPTRRVRPPGAPHGLLSRLSISQGLTVLKTGASYKTVENPAEELIRAADAVYVGGHSYPITPAERDSLTAAGYGPYITVS